MTEYEILAVKRLREIKTEENNLRIERSKLTGCDPEYRKEAIAASLVFLNNEAIGIMDALLRQDIGKVVKMNIVK